MNEPTPSPLFARLRAFATGVGGTVRRWYRSLDDDARSVLLAALVGLFTAIVGVLFHEAIHLLSLITLVGGDHPVAGVPWYLILAIPVAGGLLVGLLRRRLDPKGEGFGVGHVVEALATEEGRIPRSRSLLAGLGAVITLGTGGSAGPEGPIVQVGAGVGSGVGARAEAPSSQRRMLLGCGAAAGIATLFNAPIGGVLFVVEVITEGFGVLSLGQILIAAVTATAVRHMLLGEEPPFGDLTHLESPSLLGLVLVTLLGVGCGFLGRWLLAAWRGSHRLAKRLPGPEWTRPAFGGLVVGLCALMAPEVMGTGYGFLAELLGGYEHDAHAFPDPVDSGAAQIGVLGLLVILVLKSIATGATLTTGGAGGVFAPSLFLGAGVGALAGAILTSVGVPLQSEVLAILCMAALMSAVLHCPMTALLLVFELTRNYGLIVPTMACTVMATWVSKRGQQHSIFLMELAERGAHYRRGTDLSVLSHMTIVDMLETDALGVREDATFPEVLAVVKASLRNYFPVLDAEERLCGMIFLNDLREHMFDQELAGIVCARDLMHTAVVTVELDEAMEQVMQKFDATGAWSLPVVFLGRYRGMISRSRIQVAYRNALITETVA